MFYNSQIRYHNITISSNPTAYAANDKSAFYFLPRKVGLCPSLCSLAGTNMLHSHPVGRFPIRQLVCHCGNNMLDCMLWTPKFSLIWVLVCSTAEKMTTILSCVPQVPLHLGSGGKLARWETVGYIGEESCLTNPSPAGFTLVCKRRWFYDSMKHSNYCTQKHSNYSPNKNIFFNIVVWHDLEISKISLCISTLKNTMHQMFL